MRDLTQLSLRSRIKIASKEEFLFKAGSERQKIINSLSAWQRGQVEKTLADIGATWDQLSVETLKSAAQLKKPPRGSHE